MARVIHTCDIVYGSYSQNDYEVVCDENDELETIKSKIRRLLRLDFLSMATYQVKITKTEPYEG